mmetsp:Transcript_30390/g.64039  ORF Transcript_30390/g.64039 Transcript_30390/m.64039 type:complete len:242 (-) Transcript_30390:818-1543(-)
MAENTAPPLAFFFFPSDIPQAFVCCPFGFSPGNIHLLTVLLPLTLPPLADRMPPFPLPLRCCFLFVSYFASNLSRLQRMRSRKVSSSSNHPQLASSNFSISFSISSFSVKALVSFKLSNRPFEASSKARKGNNFFLNLVNWLSYLKGGGYLPIRSFSNNTSSGSCSNCSFLLSAFSNHSSTEPFKLAEVASLLSFFKVCILFSFIFTNLFFSSKVNRPSSTCLLISDCKNDIFSSNSLDSS